MTETEHISTFRKALQDLVQKAINEARTIGQLQQVYEILHGETHTVEVVFDVQMAEMVRDSPRKTKRTDYDMVPHVQNTQAGKGAC